MLLDGYRTRVDRLIDACHNNVVRIYPAQGQAVATSPKDYVVPIVRMSKFARRKQVIPDENKILITIRCLTIRAFSHYSNLLRGRPLRVFDLERSSIEITVK